MRMPWAVASSRHGSSHCRAGEGRGIAHVHAKHANLMAGFRNKTNKKRINLGTALCANAFTVRQYSQYL